MTYVNIGIFLGYSPILVLPKLYTVLFHLL